MRTAERHEIANSLRISGGEPNRMSPALRPRSNPFPRAVSFSRDADSNPGRTPLPSTLNKSKPGMTPGNTLNRPSGSRTTQSVSSRLTERQRTEHAVSGKCFGCGETGHLYRNCPKLNSVKGSRDRPPGRSNFNIEVDVDDIDPGSRNITPATDEVTDDAEIGPAVETEYDEEGLDDGSLDTGDVYYDEPGATEDEDPYDALELAAMCLLLGPGSETDSQDDSEDTPDDLNPASDRESAAQQSPLNSDRGSNSSELIPTRPNTPYHFFYEPNPLPNAVRMHDDVNYHVSDWSNDSFSHVGDSGSDETDIELWNSQHPKLFATGARIGEPLMQRLELILELGRPYPGDDTYETLRPRRFKCKFVGPLLVIGVRDCYTARVEHVEFRTLRRAGFRLGLWMAEKVAAFRRIELKLAPRWMAPLGLNELFRENAAWKLEKGHSEYEAVMQGRAQILKRFDVIPAQHADWVWVKDRLHGIQTSLHERYLTTPLFDIRRWHNKILLRTHYRLPTQFDELAMEDNFLGCLESEAPITNPGTSEALLDTPEEIPAIPAGMMSLELGEGSPLLDLYGQTRLVTEPEYRHVHRSAAATRDPARQIAEPLRIVVSINGHRARALVDSGSLGDFMASSLADQLKVRRTPLQTPLSVQLAAQGSRTKVNYGTTVRFQYQTIDEDRYFDIMNLSNYDLILGTAWMYQHSVTIGLNPPRIIIGSETSLPIAGGGTLKLASRSIQVTEDALEAARAHLVEYAKPLCRKASESPLPPLRAINHQIPLIDENKIYPWRPSRCPEAFLPLWTEKRDAYLKTGRWEITTATNTVPMLLVPKVGTKPGDPSSLRTVVDLRERNKNTRKLASPLPNMHQGFGRCLI